MTDFVHEAPKDPNKASAPREEKPTTERERMKKVYTYVAILFCVAFLLILWTFLMNQRSSQAIRDEIKSGNSALQSTLEENDTLEARVNELIRQDLPIDYYDESHILLGGAQHYCTGPRTHVRSTGRIIGFRLLDHFIYDHFHKTYMLVGCVGDDSEENIRKLETIHG